MPSETRLRLIRKYVPDSLKGYYDKDPDYFSATETNDGFVWRKNPNARTRHGKLYTLSRLAAVIFNRPYNQFDGTDYTLPNEQTPPKSAHNGKPWHWEPVP